MKYLKFITVLLFVIFLSNCGETKLKPQIDETISSDELPDQESTKATITFTEEGKLKAILYSDNIKVLGEKKEKLLEKMRIEFFDEYEKRTSELRSLMGKIDDATQDMYAIDSVIAVSDSGIILTTDELIWKNKAKKIVTDKFVRIVSENEIIEGYGFESDQNLRNYTIFNITYTTTLEDNER
jgi:LPS export ABC transporter protein LptC